MKYLLTFSGYKDGLRYANLECEEKDLNDNIEKLLKPLGGNICISNVEKLDNHFFNHNEDES